MGNDCRVPYWKKLYKLNEQVDNNAYAYSHGKPSALAENSTEIYLQLNSICVI